jgi:hypothetical protein
MFRQQYDALLRRRSDIDRGLHRIRKQMGAAPKLATSSRDTETRRLALTLELTAVREAGIVNDGLGRIANAEARAIVAGAIEALQ